MPAITTLITQTLTILSAWRISLLTILLLAYALGLIFVAAPIPVPGRDLSEVVWPVLSLVVVGGFIMSRKVLHEVHFEVVHPHRLWRRGALYITVILGIAGATAIAGAVAEVDPLVATRNAMFLLGVVGLCGPTKSIGAMLGLTAFACATWILGAGMLGSEPAWWAIFLAAPGELTTLLFCCGVFIAGLTTDCVLRRG